VLKKLPKLINDQENARTLGGGVVSDRFNEAVQFRNTA
jgi:hypothetical protein